MPYGIALPAASEGKSLHVDPLGLPLGPPPSPSSWCPPTRTGSPPARISPPRVAMCSGTGRPGRRAGRPRPPSRCPAGCSPRPSAAAPPSGPTPGARPSSAHPPGSWWTGTSSAAATPDPRGRPGPPAPSAPAPAAGRCCASFLRPPPAPHPRLRPAFRLPHSPADRVRVHPGRLRHRLDAAAAQPQRLRPEQEPPLPLIQVRAQQPVQPRQPARRRAPRPGCRSPYHKR